MTLFAEDEVEVCYKDGVLNLLFHLEDGMEFLYRMPLQEFLSIAKEVLQSGNKR